MQKILPDRVLDVVFENCSTFWSCRTDLSWIRLLEEVLCQKAFSIVIRIDKVNEDTKAGILCFRQEWMIAGTYVLAVDVAVDSSVYKEVEEPGTP